MTTVTRKIPVESIRRQPNEERDCAFVALQNLYVWAGLEPPTLEQMHLAARVCYTTAPEQRGLTTTEQLMLLQELRCPLLLAFGLVPQGADVRDFFPALLDAGCALVMPYFYSYDGQVYGHSVVAESWSDEGLTVLDGSTPSLEGLTLEWVMTAEAAPPPNERHALPHGCRNIIPWRTITDGDLIEQMLAPPLGIRRDFLIAWPSSGETRGLQ